MDGFYTNKINETISTQINQTQSNLDEMVANKINELISTIKEDKTEIVESNLDIADRELDNKFNQEIKEIFSLDENGDNEDTINEIKRLRKSRGTNYANIARRLTENNYPTKQGKYNWSGTQVKRILEKPENV